MKTTLTVLFLLAALISSTQTFRHIYVKWIEPTDSVLDEFIDDTESSIANAGTLADLTILYRNAHTAVKEYESNPSNPKIEYRNQRNTEPYESEQKIKKEIKNREYDEKQLFKLIFYWVCGLVSLSTGIIAFTRINRWLGVSGIIIGFSEMLCWTSPLFHNRLLSQQFQHLLDYKLIFSTITLILLITLWLLIENKGFLLKNNSNENG
jgi:hypothetical protein